VVAQTCDWHPGFLAGLLPDKVWRAARSRRSDMMDSLEDIRIAHPVVFSPRPSRFFAGRKTSWDRTSEAIVRWVRNSRWKPDIILAHFALVDGAHAVRVGERLDLPVAVMTWGDDIHQWPEKKADWADELKRTLAKADLLIACSQQMARDAAKWGAPAERWNVVYGGVDTEEFRPAKEGDAWSKRMPAGMGRVAGRRILLCVARVEKDKGHEELLAAFSRCASQLPSWDLVMAGPLGNGTVDPDALIEKLNLEERARWIGPVAPDDLGELYRSADAFVLPSYREGLSLSLLEALASGLPVVTTKVGGHPEVVDAHAGYLIAPGDANELEVALLRLLKATGDATPAGARRAAERIGTPRQNAGRLVKVLRDRVKPALQNRF
jgi:glycosyltransferase involved in cell wall biosynthesis